MWLALEAVSGRSGFQSPGWLPLLGACELGGVWGDPPHAVPRPQGAVLSQNSFLCCLLH